MWNSKWSGAPVFGTNQTTAIHIDSQIVRIIQIYIRGYYFAYLHKDLNREREQERESSAALTILQTRLYCCSQRDCKGTIKLVLDRAVNLAVSLSSMANSFVIVFDILRQIIKWMSTLCHPKKITQINFPFSLLFSESPFIHTHSGPRDMMAESIKNIISSFRGLWMIYISRNISHKY